MPEFREVVWRDLKLEQQAGWFAAATIAHDAAEKRAEEMAAKVTELEKLLKAVVVLDLSHMEEATPTGYAHWDEIFEDRVQVTAWTAWQRDVNTALAQETP